MEGTKGYCIFKKGDGGVSPVERNEQGYPRTYSTRDQAEREIARSVVERIVSHFGEADFMSENAFTVRDYIEEVEVLESGVVVDHKGNQYGSML